MLLCAAGAAVSFLTSGILLAFKAELETELNYILSQQSEAAAAG
jgi:hypothetical protein